jgi:hypothetical protein
MSTSGQVERPPELRVAGLDDNSVATNQAAVPMPHLAGESAGVLRWISPIYNQEAQEAPQARPAKK